MGSAWATTGANRNPLLMMYMIDVTLYHLHSSIPGKQIPQLRYDRYVAAKDYFERAAKGTVTLNLPRLPERSPVPINIGATIPMGVTVPAANGDTANITVSGIALTAAPIPLAAGDLSGTALSIVAAINAYSSNTGYRATALTAGNFYITMPSMLGHNGNNIPAIVSVTGTVQIMAGTSSGGRTQQLDSSLNPERMRIGSHGKRFESDF
jgi:hypothetical protein